VELQLSQDQELFRDTTRRFLEDSCPLTEVRRLAETVDGFERDWWRKGAELGWTSTLVPEALGGGSVSEHGLRDLALVAEEQGLLVSPGPLLPVNVVAAALAAASDPAPHAEVLNALIAGEAVATWCFEEPGRPFGAAGISVTATPDGDGFVLNGVKAPVEAAGQADHLLVTARTQAGLTQVLVPAGAAGITVTPRKSVDLTRRFATVRFDGVKVPGSAVVGAVGDAGAAVERQLQIALVLQLAEMCGVIDRVFQFTVEWAFDRYSFGRPLASYQALKHRFADMKLWLEASQATTGSALRAVQAERADAGELVSVAKSYVADRAPELIQDCVQMHGGIGVTWDHDIHLYLRRVTLDAGLYGTVRDHRLRLAAVAGLG
jgi:alkylation response protein AidB-like acyl-CoA dehydrogenase